MGKVDVKNLIQQIFAEGHRRQLTGLSLRLLVIIASILSIYQVWTVLYTKIDPINQMAIHLSFILVLTFFLYSFSKKGYTRNVSSLDIVLIVLSAACGVYYAFHADRIAHRMEGIDLLTNADIIVGLIFVMLCLEAARRTIGFSITLVALLFMLYALFGHLLGGVLFHSQMTLTDVIEQLAFSFNGLWGSPIAVASSFVFTFVLFGAFLQHSGASKFFFDLSVSIAGRSKGGAAKIAIVASAFFGAISGSPTANVVTTGAFTIPMAKRLGYSPRFAAAIEACASTGGSFLPPIMGSSAFLMAAVTGISYSSIVIAAILPAILYYLFLFFLVHFEAIRIDLPRSKDEDIPEIIDVLTKGWIHIVPLIILTALLLKGYSPSRTGIYAIIAVVFVSWLHREKMGPRRIFRALTDGALSAIPISTSCAAAGLVIAGIMSTGLGSKINSIILNLTAGHLLMSLILVALLCLILGMGMPVAAAYVLTAMLAAPTLIHLGVSTMAAHLFIVYFSIISAITPPVAVAAFAAAGIAKTNPIKVGFDAVRLGLASFIIPFAFIYHPGLLMEGTVMEIVIAVFLTTAGMLIVGCGVIGFYQKQATLLLRLGLILSGIFVIHPNWVICAIGIGSAIWLYFYQYNKKEIIATETTLPSSYR